MSSTFFNFFKNFLGNKKRVHPGGHTLQSNAKTSDVATISPHNPHPHQSADTTPGSATPVFGGLLVLYLFFASIPSMIAWIRSVLEIADSSLFSARSVPSVISITSPVLVLIPLATDSMVF